jgi:hypothetical protein
VFVKDFEPCLNGRKKKRKRLLFRCPRPPLIRATVTQLSTYLQQISSSLLLSQLARISRSLRKADSSSHKSSRELNRRNHRSSASLVPFALAPPHTQPASQLTAQRSIIRSCSFVRYSTHLVHDRSTFNLLAKLISERQPTRSLSLTG